MIGHVIDGGRIREPRRALCLTQAELGAKVGVAQNASAGSKVAGSAARSAWLNWRPSSACECGTCWCSRPGRTEPSPLAAALATAPAAAAAATAAPPAAHSHTLAAELLTTATQPTGTARTAFTDPKIPVAAGD